MATETLGLRERKKLRTRETIVREALRLFDERGYERTTIAQIAEAADVAPRTVSSYFAAKEDIVFDAQEAAFARLAERLENRPEGEMAPEALRGWILDLMEGWREKREEHRARHRVVESNEALCGHRQLQIARAQDLLADAIAVDIGVEPGDVRARMAAASTTAIIETLGDYVEPKKSDPGASDAELDAAEAEVLKMLDQAVVFVGAGIRALRGGPAASS